MRPFALAALAAALSLRACGADQRLAGLGVADDDAADPAAHEAPPAYTPAGPRAQHGHGHGPRLMRHEARWEHAALSPEVDAEAAALLDQSPPSPSPSPTPSTGGAGGSNPSLFPGQPAPVPAPASGSQPTGGGPSDEEEADDGTGTGTGTTANRPFQVDAAGNTLGEGWALAAPSKNKCPTGGKYLGFQECGDAAKRLQEHWEIAKLIPDFARGFQTELSFGMSAENEPKGCFLRKGLGVMFNKHRKGKGSALGRPLCGYQGGSFAPGRYGNISGPPPYFGDTLAPTKPTAVPTSTASTSSTTSSTTSTTTSTKATTTTQVSVNSANNASKDNVTDNSTNATNATNATAPRKRRSSFGAILLGALVVLCCCGAGGAVVVVQSRGSKGGGGGEEEEGPSAEKPAAEVEGAGAAAEGGEIGIGSRVTVISSGRVGTVTYGPDANWSYTVAYEDDGSTSDLLPYGDLQLVPAEAAAEGG